MNEALNLHEPNLVKKVLDKLHLRQVQPGDIGNKDEIFRVYPDLGGDPEFGLGNYGDCPSWRNDWGWHERFIRDQKAKQKR